MKGWENIGLVMGATRRQGREVTMVFRDEDDAKSYMSRLNEEAEAEKS